MIDITRRRVTKDGRVKVKLALAGVDVEKCGICLNQFKAKDLGACLKCNHW